ncbi:LLM class flavin-dependent oxidoreductase [Streptomyces sp. 110]|uniref:LLM class flavin-dependent oxidoreductase n=1 Tax=Streptomyces endocoffeicus TaxID=2898945 RepID=A0ABS1Q9F1_9ACTN|nr:LLM class flavin-dependent oxidoreductase [Streptomyces endocoffeicus]MBL1120940.1 LLM class flavin-dependent oxidoreductase [Streptomyces endocoffeicus]
MPAELRRHVILNVNVLDVGFTPDAWRHNDLDRLAFADAGYYQRIGRIAERGTLDALFLADSPGLADPRVKPSLGLEPTLILGAVAAVTENLGLIGTASSTFNDPWELAYRFLSLDYVSGGRAAWNVVTSWSPAAAANFGLSELPDRDARYRRAREFVEVVTSLWRSANGGPAVEYRGEFFDISGRLPAPVSAQGFPLLVQAGGSPAGRELAGREANAVFSAELSLHAGIEHYNHVKAVAAAAGRDPAQVKILPGLITTIGSTEGEARRRHEETQALSRGGFPLSELAGALGVRPDELDLDALLPRKVLNGPPDPAHFTGSLGFRESVVRLATEEGLVVRDLLTRLAGGHGHRQVVGTPEQVADTIEQWFRAGAADGFNLMPDRFPDGLEVFADHVVPLLRRRGLFRHEYEDRTLRGRLNIPISQPAAAIPVGS